MENDARILDARRLWNDAHEAASRVATDLSTNLPQSLPRLDICGRLSLKGSYSEALYEALGGEKDNIKQLAERETSKEREDRERREAVGAAKWARAQRMLEERGVFIDWPSAKDPFPFDDCGPDETHTLGNRVRIVVDGETISGPEADS